MKIWKRVFVGYIFLVFLLNVLPVNGSSSSLNHVYIIHLRLDYWVHMVMFLPWMGISLLGFRGWMSKPGKPFQKTALILLAGILFAAACESIQYLATWRTFNINDLLANILGVLLGIISLTLNHLKLKA